MLEAVYHGDQALEPYVHPCLITASPSCQDRFVIDSSLSRFCFVHLMTLSFHILCILQAVFLSPVSPALCPAFSAILLFSFYTTRLSPPWRRFRATFLVTVRRLRPSSVPSSSRYVPPLPSDARTFDLPILVHLAVLKSILLLRNPSQSVQPQLPW